MSKWEHAKIGKRVINLDFQGDRRVMCAWDNCEAEGYELYKCVVHDHRNYIACDNPSAKHIGYVFCTERHKMYWVNSTRSYGNLPSGYRF
jgi:hypothetical protein